MATCDVEETQQIVSGSNLPSISEENEIDFETNQNFLFQDQIQATVEADCDTFDGMRCFQSMKVPSFSELKRIIEYQDHVFAASSKTSSLSEFLLYSKDHDLGNISSRTDDSEAVENEGDFTTDREYFKNTYYNNIFYDELNDDTESEEEQQTIQGIRELDGDND